MTTDQTARIAEFVRRLRAEASQVCFEVHPESTPGAVSRLLSEAADLLTTQQAALEEAKGTNANHSDVRLLSSGDTAQAAPVPVLQHARWEAVGMFVKTAPNAATNTGDEVRAYSLAAKHNEIVEQLEAELETLRRERDEAQEVCPFVAMQGPCTCPDARHVVAAHPDLAPLTALVEEWELEANGSYSTVRNGHNDATRRCASQLAAAIATLQGANG